MPLEDLVDGKAWIATVYEGDPLEPEHGGPARLLVPHLYLLTVELLPDGEASSCLVGELRVGDELELRGPVGGYFVAGPRLSSKPWRALSCS